EREREDRDDQDVGDGHRGDDAALADHEDREADGGDELAPEEEPLDARGELLLAVLEEALPRVARERARRVAARLAVGRGRRHEDWGRGGGGRAVRRAAHPTRPVTGRASAAA